MPLELARFEGIQDVRASLEATYLFSSSVPCVAIGSSPTMYALCKKAMNRIR